MNVWFKRIDARAKMPSKAYDSAGYDLFPLDGGRICVNCQATIMLGFASEFSKNYVAVIDDRGSVGYAGLSHMAGVIDSDFRGEWGVILRNFSDEVFYYSPDKAVAQVLFLPVESPQMSWARTLTPSKRGKGMLGSSNKEAASEKFGNIG